MPLGRTTAAALPEGESAADSLRKVQQALAGGSPDELLVAATALQHCSTMSRAPADLFAVRDQPDIVTPPVKKMLADMGSGMVTNDQIAFAQREQRRCQVFDAATMARRGELYQRAYEGGAGGSAIAYLQWLRDPMEPQKNADPALIASVLTAAHQAAQAGDPNALMAFAMSGSDGVIATTPTQRLAYRNAWVAIQEERFPGTSQGLVKVIDAVARMTPQPALTAAQQRDAEALTQQVVVAWRRGRKS
ncbi:MAG: hypothetical protein EOO64_02105 [Massilia sp.]|nr:MAG: hypothetical protein EOO64_02105 [Massilia sp.]